MFDEPLTVNDYAYFKFALRVPGKENVGVELRCHLIVAGAEVGSVNIPSVNSEKSNK